jgi:hypothetical protein
MGVAGEFARCESLVERAARGDVEAFEELYRENVGRVYLLCLRMCGDPSSCSVTGGARLGGRLVSGRSATICLSI